MKAETFVQEGNYAQAAELFQQAFSLDRVNPEYWIELGLALGRLHRFQEAENAYSTGIELDPTSATLYFHRGRAKYAQNKYKEAIEDFNHAYTLDDSDMRDHGLYNAFLYAGQSYEALEQYENAVDSYKAYAYASGSPYAGDPHIKRVKEKMSARIHNQPGILHSQKTKDG